MIIAIIRQESSRSWYVDKTVKPTELSEFKEFDEGQSFEEKANALSLLNPESLFRVVLFNSDDFGQVHSDWVYVGITPIFESGVLHVQGKEKLRSTFDSQRFFYNLREKEKNND